MSGILGAVSEDRSKETVHSDRRGPSPTNATIVSRRFTGQGLLCSRLGFSCRQGAGVTQRGPSPIYATIVSSSQGQGLLQCYRVGCSRMMRAKPDVFFLVLISVSSFGGPSCFLLHHFLLRCALESAVHECWQNRRNAIGELNTVIPLTLVMCELTGLVRPNCWRQSSLEATLSDSQNPER